MKRIPCATYRLQFNRDFTFNQARELLDYFRELGISDVYASPLFQAGPQSTHGYDTCSFGKINPNLGSEGDFEKFAEALKAHGLGLLLDIVPNHMSATLANAWWVDVLEKGSGSPFAQFFDIDWRPNDPVLRDKVLLPVLEDHYEKVLESGKLRLVFEGEKLFIAYYDRNFPVNQNSIAACGLADLKKIPAELNGTPGNVHSFDRLDVLIQRQHYRLAYWKLASEKINYRRFFDVTEMVALKMELPEVFRETHKLVFEWLDHGKITGLRVDHPDGLWNPKEYLQRLQRDNSPYLVVEKILSADEQLPADWPVDGTTGYDFLNRLNGLFVDGASASAFDSFYREFTGNDEGFASLVYRSRKQVLERSFGSEVNSLTFRLQDIAARTSTERDFTFQELHQAVGEFAANFPVYRTYITENTTEISAQDRKVIQEAAKAAREHADPKTDRVAFDFLERLLMLELGTDLDQGGLKSAREFVMKFQQLSGPAMAKGLEDTAFYRFNRLISLNEVGGEPGRFGVSSDEFHAANEAIAKLWPHTMLASATHDTKRGEDARARLNVLSEMPDEWEKTVAQWSRFNHDKKSVTENASAPDANAEYLFYQTLIGAWLGDLNDGESLKSFRARVGAFMLKATKEAKVRTSWTDPNLAYEKALLGFVEKVLTPGGNREFLDDCVRFSKRVSFFGKMNSLAQTLLKMTSPGVPDFYQGAELWDLNLVDPDNRRPVDFVLRQKILSELKSKFAEVGDAMGDFFPSLLRDEQAGAMKLFLIWRVLTFRGTQRELFDRGDYLPLVAIGEQKSHVCAFARKWKERTIVVAVPRLVFGLSQGAEAPPIGEIWKDTLLPVPHARAGDLFRNVLTREMVPAIEVNKSVFIELRQAMKTFPVALLEKI
jgi:(1->4)-alpha-D-glucan 1-alpha-D-glucosylmutase